MIFEAGEDNIGKRLDSFLSENMENVSRSYIQKLIESGDILINEKAVNKNYKIRKGDMIKAEIPEAEEIEIKAENIPLDILYEDDDVIVINKEQGMVVHPAAGHYTGTLVNALMYHCRDSLSGINGKLRPGIVHRIDMDTSGVIVAAKNDTAHQCLAEQLEKHSMKRIYIAIVEKNVKDDEGTIDKPIGRHPTDRKKMAITDKNSKRAVTHYKVIERLGKFTVVRFMLETGRTHQIRVHFASIGHPLVGDTVYGSKKNTYGAKGQALHAKVLGFIHPRTKEYMEFESPLPEYFIKLAEKLKKLR